MMSLTDEQKKKAMLLTGTVERSIDDDLKQMSLFIYLRNLKRRKKKAERNSYQFSSLFV